MKKMKSLIPIFFMMLFLFSACHDSVPADESIDAAVETEVGITGRVLVTPEHSDYAVVYGETADKNEVRAAAEIKTVVVERSGYMIPLSSDWKKEWETVEEVRNSHEIIVGSTNRPESETARKMLEENKKDGVSRWLITWVGDHVVLLGDSGLGTILAANYFSENFVSAEGVFIPDNALPIFMEYTDTASETDLFQYPNNMTFFTPENGRTGDVIPIWHDGKYYVFFLYAGQGKWAYTTTEDFVNYSDVVVLKDYGGTGDVLFVDGIWHLFAAHRDSQTNEEVIYHYTGTDLQTLEKTGEGIRADESRFAKHAWRDPRVWYDDSIGKYKMLVCTDTADGNQNARNGAVAWLTSDDLNKWEIGGTFFSSAYYAGSDECPDYFKMGDWYYLIYSNCSFGKRTYYVKSKSPNGPWEIPDHDTFDSLFFYAAKTASDGLDRYIFGWAGDRGTEKYPMNDKTDYSLDFSTIQYAGDMIVHKLEQKENGDLVSVPVQSILDSFTIAKMNSMSAIEGNWVISEDQKAASVQTEGMAALKLQPARNRFMMTFKMKTNAKEAGIGLHVPQNLVDKGYYFGIERLYSRLRVRSGELTGEKGYYFPFESEFEQPIHFDSDKTYDMTLLCDGEIMVVYVNGECALSLRGTDSDGLFIALWCYAGSAEFSDIVVKTK